MINNFKRYSFLVNVVFLNLLIISCASTSTAPLPPSINMIEPSPDMPKELAAYSGLWKGQWEGALDTYFVVEKINMHSALVIFSIGHHPLLILQPHERYERIKARVNSASEIEFNDASGNRFIFKLDKSLNELRGYFINKNKGSKTRCIYKRAETNKLHAVDVKLYEYPPKKVIITTNLNENNRPIDEADQINLNANSFYVFTHWLDLPLQNNFYSIQIYDASGKRLYTDDIYLTPTEPEWNTWSKVRIKKWMPPGLWTVNIFLGDELVATKQIRATFSK